LETDTAILEFANLTFRGLRREDLLRENEELKLIVTVNAEIIETANRDPHLAEIINRNWATLDGQWPYVLAKRQSGRKDIEKISGSDFVRELCVMAAARGLRVFLLGADASVNKAACTRLRREVGVAIEGYAPQLMSFPFPHDADAAIMERVAEFSPQILVLAFGAPKQEFWADAHLGELKALGIRWVIGAGGTLDFIAGTLRRAPLLVQRAGLEWLWRLALQPKLRFRRLLRAAQFMRYIK
jgi:N-acetylglucosaminyldiphosphoundecaprenol N-acetyl-beta-D-mannosaminyltransferase